MLTAAIKSGTRKKGRVLVCALREGAKKASWSGVPAGLTARLRKGGDGLQGGDHITLYAGDGVDFEHVLRLEILEDPEVDEGEWFRRAGAHLFDALAKHDVGEAYLLRAAGEDFDLESFAEGYLLASYVFADYMSEKPKAGGRTLVVAPGSRAVDLDALDRAGHVVESVCLARDLVNTPAADLYPESFAAAARKVARRHKLKVHVVSGKPLEKGYPAVYAVGKGSERPPRVIRVDYAPRVRGAKHVVLVGKGITYDSGGYDIKYLESMYLMKKDMGGAAACLGALDLAARLKLPINVTCIIAAAENMISGGAFRPGDVIDSRAGKTIEIYSTDAEGRLVLADALAWGTELKPDVMIDLATLTGAAKAFFSDLMSPVMGTDPELVADLAQAGRETHERLIPLELLREYREATKGRISDVKNWGKVGGGGGGTMVAGGFLRHFVGDTPWAHIDMSNTSWAGAPVGYTPFGATAFGVRLLAQYLADRCLPE